METDYNILFVIPARGGSKGIPQKNIKPLCGKPLIYYSIDVAREITSDKHIIVSSDDDTIIQMVEKYGLKVPFKRPEYLATDTASTNDVILHALHYFENKGINYDVVVILQPTSPLRTSRQVKEAIALFTHDVDMVVSVKESKSASVLCEENLYGFLDLTFNKKELRRQDMPIYYEYNGAIYVINAKSLREKPISGFIRKKKYVMDEQSSIDIDTYMDWIICENILKNNF